MKLYFDTNVYNFIAACGESNSVRRFLDGLGYTVQASGENLFEIYAICCACCLRASRRRERVHRLPGACPLLAWRAVGL